MCICGGPVHSALRREVCISKYEKTEYGKGKVYFATEDIQYTLI